MDYTSIFGELTKQVQVRIDAASDGCFAQHFGSFLE